LHPRQPFFPSFQATTVKSLPSQLTGLPCCWYLERSSSLRSLPSSSSPPKRPSSEPPLLFFNGRESYIASDPLSSLSCCCCISFTTRSCGVPGFDVSRSRLPFCSFVFTSDSQGPATPIVLPPRRTSFAAMFPPFPCRLEGSLF